MGLSKGEVWRGDHTNEVTVNQDSSVTMKLRNNHCNQMVAPEESCKIAARMLEMHFKGSRVHGLEFGKSNNKHLIMPSSD